MRFFVAAFVAAALLGAPAWADSLVIGGQAISCDAPLEVTGTEILAPLLPGLDRLGAKVTASSDAVTIIAGAATIRFKPGSATAQVNGKPYTLAAAPRRQGEAWLLPARSLAKLLGANARFDEQTRTLFLHHRVTDVGIEPIAGGMRLRVIATGVLASTAGLLKATEEAPARLYLDIEHADLAGPAREVPVNRGGIIALHAAQHWLNPDIVRVVLDLKQPVEYHHRTEQAGRAIVLDLLTPPREPVALQGVEIASRGERAAEIRIKAEGPIAARARVNKTTVSFVLANAIPPDPLPQVTGKHPLLKSVTLVKGDGAASDPLRLEVVLARRAGYALSPRGDGLRIVIGALRLSDVHIVLDAGHGGSFPGAQGRTLDEKEVNLDVVRRAAKLLRAAGARVTLTREGDTTLVPIDRTSKQTAHASLRQDLLARVAVAKQVAADIFLSVHCNSSNDRDTHFGSETYYCSGRNRALAQTMLESLVRNLGTMNGGVHEREFVVCKYPPMPAALLELAYINNRQEEALLADSHFRDRCARAIFDGLREFVEGGALLQNQLDTSAQPEEAAPAEQPAPETEAEPAGQPAPDKQAEPAKQPEPKKEPAPAKEPAKEPAKPSPEAPSTPGSAGGGDAG